MRTLIILAAALALVACTSTTYHVTIEPGAIANHAPAGKTEVSEVDGQITVSRELTLPDGTTAKLTGGGYLGNQAVLLYLGADSEARSDARGSIAPAVTGQGAAETTATVPEAPTPEEPSE